MSNEKLLFSNSGVIKKYCKNWCRVRDLWECPLDDEQLKYTSDEPPCTRGGMTLYEAGVKPYTLEEEIMRLNGYDRNQPPSDGSEWGGFHKAHLCRDGTEED